MTKWTIPEPADALETIRQLRAANAALHYALAEARAQLAYLDDRQPTGTTPAVIARIDAALNPPADLAARLGAGK